jgi:hypothetical protein
MNHARGALAVAGALSTTAVAPAIAQTPTADAPVRVATGNGAQAAGGSRSGAPGLASPKPAKSRGSFGIRSARRNVTLGDRTLVKGTLRPARAGRRVQLQVRVADDWKTVARDVTDRRGAWRLRHAPERPSASRTRVAFAGDARTRAVARSIGTVNVFRRALASWYGPGLYGGRLACGGRLSPGTLGVAHKALPCGTKVTLRHRGRSVRVEVVDRGPYVGAREFDLTSATRSRLGFSGTGTILTTR